MYYVLSVYGEVKGNVDGLRLRNFGIGGCVVVFIGPNKAFLGCGFKGLGVVKNYLAECYGALYAIEMAKQNSGGNQGGRDI